MDIPPDTNCTTSAQSTLERKPKKRHITFQCYQEKVKDKMYMATRANLDYWSTDNCCFKWSLQTGAVLIGILSLFWQSFMVVIGVMIIVTCPVQPANETLYQNDTNTTLDTNDTITVGITIIDTTYPTDTIVDTLEPSDTINPDTIQNDITNRRSIRSIARLEDQAIRQDNTAGPPCAGRSDSTSTNDSYVNSTYINITFVTCPWLPGPEIEVLGIHNTEQLMLVAGIWISYSGIYTILSLCVIVGALKASVTLLQGWVAMTGFHNLVILAFLLVPLPFTTLPYLLLTIAHFIINLYVWAVVKSYRHKLKVEANKPLLPEGAITDYTVDGVDVTEIPVAV